LNDQKPAVDVASAAGFFMRREMDQFFLDKALSLF